jgi:hypothetical protein
VETAVKKEMNTYQGRWTYQARDGNPAEQPLAVSDEIGAVAITVGAGSSPAVAVSARLGLHYPAAPGTGLGACRARPRPVCLPSADGI